jgi:hypothetical protein
MFACLAGTRSASSLPFHLIKNISSPEESVAPIIRSGWRPRSNPLGLASSVGCFAFLAAGSSVLFGAARLARINKYFTFYIKISQQ